MKYLLAFTVFIAAMVATPTGLYMLAVSEKKKAKVQAASGPLISEGLKNFTDSFYPDLPKGYGFSTSVRINQIQPVGEPLEPIDLTIELKAGFWSDSVVRVPFLERTQIRAFLPNSILMGDCERDTICKHTFTIPPGLSVVCLDAEVQIEGLVYQSSKACMSSPGLTDF